MDNPTVVTLERDYRNWMYRPMAITYCSEFIDNNTVDAIVERYWNVKTDNCDEFKFYELFVRTIAMATYANVDSFEPFENMSLKFSGDDMLNIAREVK